MIWYRKSDDDEDWGGAKSSLLVAKGEPWIPAQDFNLSKGPFVVFFDGYLYALSHNGCFLIDKEEIQLNLIFYLISVGYEIH